MDGKVLYNGTVKSLITADKLLAGDKIATVVFYGDDNYDELTVTAEFTVSRVTPDITVVIDDVTYPAKAVAVITVGNNANGTVNVTVDGKLLMLSSSQLMIIIIMLLLVLTSMLIRTLQLLLFVLKMSMSTMILLLLL